MDYLPGILSGESDEIFMGYFKANLYHLFEDSLQDAPSGIPQDYILNHMVSDFAETIRWWSKHKQYTPEEISSFFFRTTPLP